LKALNKATCPDTSTFPSIGGMLDYNIVEDMKKMQAKLSIYELAMIVGQPELIVLYFSNLQ